MPRQETIKVTIDKQSAEQSLQALQNKADALKKSLANVKVADAKSSSQQLANEAKNTQALAKAEKELENATKARLAAQKEAIAVATAQINAEKAAQNAKKAASQAAQAQIKTQTQALKLSQQIEKAADREAKVMRSLGEAMGTVNAGQATSIASMTQYIRSQEGMQNATVRATGAIHNSAGSFQTYSASVRTADGAMQTYRYSVNTTTGDVYKLDKGVKSLSVTLGTAGKAALSFVKQIVGFYGAAQSIRYALKEMKSMSDEMIVYQKVTKATDQQMEQIRKQSYATAKAYGQTPTDFLSAAQEMARAGYGEQASAMADLAVKTKLVGDITAEEASKFLLAVDAGYKYSGSIEQLSSVLDSANEIGNNYATSIGKISEGMTLVASLAGQVNVPINELIAALGTMTAVTQRSGSEMARALRSVFLNVLGDTETEIEEGVTVAQENIDSMTQALMEYGDEATKAALAAGQLINPMEAIGALAKAYKEGRILPKDLFDISKNIAGQRYYNAFAALIQNYDGMYKEMLQTANNAAGSADKEIDVLTKSWTTKFNRLKTQWVEMVNASISEGLIKDLIEGGTAALEFAGKLENLAGVALGAKVAIGSLGAGIANLQKGAKFGGFNIATSGIGVAIAAISALKALGENQFSSAVKSAQKAAEETQKAVSNAQSMTKLVAKYNKLAKDGKIDNKELNEAKNIQEQIKTLVGDTAKNYDLVNGNVKTNIQLLKQATMEYLKQQQQIAQTESANAGVKLKEAHGNWLDRFTMAGLDFDLLQKSQIAGKSEIEEYIKKNFKYTEEYYNNMSRIKGETGYQITLDRNASISEIIDFYEKAVKLQDMFAKSYSADELSKIGFYKDLIGGIEKMAPAVAAYKTAMESKLNVDAAVILNEEKFTEQTFKSEEALRSWVDALIQAKGYDADMGKALLDMALAMANVQQSTGKASDGNNKTEKSYMTLADAIEEATKAKEKFDDAMKKTKADEANAYTKAFKTYKDEVKKGRVNSTAFYAAARMLLGDEAYNATGGSSSAVRKAMQKRGGSGSIQQAWNILSASYKNKKGVEMEGYGIYQLLSQTKGVKGLSSKTLVDKNGNIRIPKLSDQQWNQISKQWGGISKAALLNYFNSFDQYNKKGKATDDKVKTAKKKQETDQQKNTKSINSATKAVEDATAAVNDLAGKLGKDENPGEGEGDKGGEGGGETPPPTEPPAETPTDTTGGVDLSTKKAEIQELNDSMDTLIAKVTAFNGTPISAEVTNETQTAIDAISSVISALSGEEGYTFNFQTGASVEEETGKVKTLQEALDGIDTLVSNGVITADFGETLKANITAAVNALNQESIAGPKVTLEIDTEEAEKKLLKIVSPDGGYKAEIKVMAETEGAATALSTILSDLNTLEAMKEGGHIPEEVYFDVKGNLQEALASIIPNIQSVQEIEQITVSLESNNMLDDDTKKLLEKQLIEASINVNTKFSTTAGKLTDIVSNLEALERMKNGGNITEDVYLEAKGNLLDSLATILQNINGINELSTLYVSIDEKNLLDDSTKALIGNSVIETSVKVKTEVGDNADKIGTVVANLQALEGMKNEGKISEDVYLEAKGNLLQALTSITEKTTTLDGLGELYVTLAAKNLVDDEIDNIFNKKYDALQIGVGVDPNSTTTYKQWLDGLPKSKTILPVIKDSAAKTAIGKLTKTEYKDVWVTVKTTGDGGGNSGRAGNGTGGGSAGSGTGGGTPGGAGGVSSGSGSGAAGWDKPRFNKGYATGTNSFSGGAALVNDGAGPELIVNRGRAFIAGGGKPTVVNLDKGARIFTATETRNILNNGGMPSFAGGTGEYSANVKPGDYKSDSDKNKKNNKSSKSKKKSKDKDNDSFSKLQTMVDYIINRIGTAVSEQIKVIDEQIANLQKERELQKQQNELAEKQKAVADAQKDLQDAMKERTVRYLGEDGKWHWQADARKVKSAQENLDKAKKDLKEYKEEVAFNKKVEKLENKKTNLQNNYDTLSKQWSDIVAGVNTPTGTINKLLSDVMKNGTKQEKEGAKAIQNVLLKNAKSGKFSGNYSEALRAIAAATAGNPVMPGDTSTTLASLIAGAGGESISSSLKSVLSTATAKSKKSKTSTFKTIGGTTQNTITNYYVNGAKIGADTAKNKSLSAVLDELKVYAGG